MANIDLSKISQFIDPTKMGEAQTIANSVASGTQYKYVDSKGKTRTTTAKSSAEALRNAPDIGRTSGVQLMGGPITPQDMSNASVTPKLPPPPVADGLVGAGAGAQAYMQSNPPVDTSTKPKTASELHLESLMNVKPIDSLKLKEDLLKQEDVKAKNDSARALKARIDGINAQAQAAQEQLESQAGTGKDITGTFLGRQQQEIQRQAAIQTLPLLADYQAALGDYQAAKETVNELYTAQLRDLESQREYNMKIHELAIEMARDDEKEAIRASELQKEREYQTQRDTIAFDREKEMAKYEAGLKGTDSGTGSLSEDNALIVNTILASNKFTKEQKQYLVNAANSGMDMTYIVKNQAKTSMSGTTATKVEAQELSLASLQRLDGLMKDYYANGGKSNIFVGNLEKVIGKLGTVQDPKLREIATDIEASLQTYRNAISGTAYSNQEGKAIASIFPGIDKTEGLNTSILNSRINGISNLIDSAYINVLGPDVYGIIKQSPVSNQQQEVVQSILTEEDNAIADTVLGDIQSAVDSGGSWWSDFKKGLGF